jgi:peptidoglycan/LPS O-acetylase OafA/YrhL
MDKAYLQMYKLLRKRRRADKLLDIKNKTTLDGNRDQTIDILRCIALFAIFLAHVNPPDFLFRLRNFDVVLMIICMTWSYAISRKKRYTPYYKYIVKRFKRLILPTWAYLTVLLGAAFVISIILNHQFIYSRYDIVMGYFLLYKVEYIWIMRVYLYIAILSPILYLVSNKIKSNLLYFGMLTLIYFAYGIIYMLGKNISNDFLYNLFDIGVLQFLGWGIVAAIGIRLFYIKDSKINYAITIIAFSSIFVVEMWLNKFATTQYFKYPPKLYYISYGIAVSLILYILVKYINSRINNGNNKNSCLLTFISKNSMELYFCQALLLEIINHYYTFGFKSNFILYWIFLIIASMSITYILKKLNNMKKRIIL